jgi:hypothetical protein
VQSDERGFRMAVVTDELVNTPPPGLDVLGVLERTGWGAIVLPPSWYPDDVKTELNEQFAEHIEEFLRHGYSVVCVGSCEPLTAPLTALGLAIPDSISPSDDAELEQFLGDRAG